MKYSGLNFYLISTFSMFNFSQIIQSHLIHLRTSSFDLTFTFFFLTLYFVFQWVNDDYPELWIFSLYLFTYRHAHFLKISLKKINALSNHTDSIQLHFIYKNYSFWTILISNIFSSIFLITFLMNVRNFEVNSCSKNIQLTRKITFPGENYT